MKFLPVIIDRPPNFPVIDAAFNVAGKPVIFAFGGKIYNPESVPVSVELQAHETVHCDRQGADPEKWWNEYIERVEFRLAEELVAHQAEYAAYCRRHHDRNKRARYLHATALRLSGPLYGSLISHQGASNVIAFPNNPFGLTRA